MNQVQCNMKDVQYIQNIVYKAPTINSTLGHVSFRSFSLAQAFPGPT